MHRHRKHAAERGLRPGPPLAQPPADSPGAFRPPPPLAPSGSFAGRDLDAHAVAVETLDALRSALVASIGLGDPVAVSKVANSITSAARLLARLSGQLEISQAMIVRSRPWKDLMVILDRVLERHPAAARDWVDALRAAEGDG